MTRRLAFTTLILGTALAACQPQAPAASPAPDASAATAAPAAPAAGGASAPAAQPPATAAAARPVVTQPPAPPKPQPIVIPEGTTLRLALESPLSTATSQAGDVVSARLSEDLTVAGKVVAPAGSDVRGRVTTALRSGKVKGLARLVFTFESLSAGSRTATLETTSVDITADPSKGKDAAMIGGGAGAGAIIGAIIGGKKGAAIGAGVGAAAGTGTVLATRGKEVELPAGQAIHVSLIADARLD